MGTPSNPTYPLGLNVWRIRPQWMAEEDGVLRVPPALTPIPQAASRASRATVLPFIEPTIATTHRLR